MASNRDEILRLVFEATGDEQLRSIAASLLEIEKAGGAAAPAARELLDQFAKLGTDQQNIDALIKLKTELHEVDGKLLEASNGFVALNKEFKQGDESSRTVTAAFAKAETQVKSLQERHSELIARVAATSGALQKNGVDVEHLDSAQRGLQNSLTETGNRAVALAHANTEASASHEKHGEALGKVREYLRGTAESTVEFGKKLLEISGIAGVVSGALATITGFRLFERGVEEARSEEDALARLKAAVGGNVKEFEHLKEAAEHAAESVGTTGNDSINTLTKLTAAFGNAGDAAKALPATLTLGKAAQIEFGDAAQIVTETLKSFGLGAEHAGEVADKLAAIASRTGVNLADLGRGAAQIAPLAKEAGVGFDGVASALAELSSKGFDAQKSNAALRELFLALGQPTSKLRQDLVGLAVDTSSFGSILDGLRRAGARGTEALQELSAKGRAGIAALVQGGSDDLRRFQAILDESSGAANKTATIIGSTLDGALKAFGRTTDDIASNLVKEALPSVTEEIRKLDAEAKEFGKTEAFKSVKEGIKDFVAGAVKAFDEFVHSIDWKELGKTIADYVKSAKESLSSLGESIGSVSSVFSKFGAIVGAVWNGIKVIFDSIAGATSAIATAVTANFAYMFERLDEALGIFTDKFRDKAAQLRDLQKQYWENTKSFFGGAGDAAVKAADDLAKLAAETDKAGTKAATAKDQHKAHGEALKESGEHAHEAAAQFANVTSSMETVSKSAADMHQAVAKATQGLVPDIDAMTASWKKAGISASDLKAAAAGLGVTLQSDLKAAADRAAEQFAKISAASKGTEADLADTREAFLAYAAAQLKAVASLGEGQRDAAKYMLESRASALGLNDQMDALEKQILKTGNTASNAGGGFGNLGNGLDQAAAKAKDYKDALAGINDHSKTMEQRISDAQKAIELAGNSTEKAKAQIEAAGLRMEVTSEQAQALAAAAAGAQASFNAVSQAAGEKFTEVMDRASQNAGLTKLAVQDVTKSLGALNAAAADTTGFGAYFKALAGAQETVRHEIDSQRASLQAQSAAFADFANNAGASLDDLKTKIGGGVERLYALDQQLKDGTYNAGLLGQQDLGPFQQAVQAAIAKVNALTNAEKAAKDQLDQLTTSLQDQLDQANNNQDALEQRRHDNQLKQIEALKGADLDEYNKAVALEDQLHQKKMADIAAQQKAQSQPPPTPAPTPAPSPAPSPAPTNAGGGLNSAGSGSSGGMTFGPVSIQISVAGQPVNDPVFMQNMLQQLIIMFQNSKGRT